jgi:hypothetical protein
MKMKNADDKVTAVYVSQRDLRAAVGMMERSLSVERNTALNKVGGMFPLDSKDAATITELEQIVRRFRRSMTEAL